MAGFLSGLAAPLFHAPGPALRRPPCRKSTGPAPRSAGPSRRTRSSISWSLLGSVWLHLRDSHSQRARPGPGRKARQGPRPSWNARETWAIDAQLSRFCASGGSRIRQRPLPRSGSSI